MANSKHFANSTSAASELWKRLASWYGARLLDQFGTQPPPDWRETIEQCSADVIARALAEIKIEHPVHPPTFPQFAAIVSRMSYIRQHGPLPQYRLCDFVIAHRTLTPAQYRNWTYVYRGDVCVAVDIPADPVGGVPGFRVRVEEIPYA